MWECKYGKEPLDTRLFVLRFLKKIPVVILAAILGAACVGGPYFLTKVTFGPAKEYEAVSDFYIDYAVQENGEEYTGFNQTTWTQLVLDDVFVDKILIYMADKNAYMDAQLLPVCDIEKAAGITKEQLRDSLYATMLSDTRIVTTTVRTNDPALTMRIEAGLAQAMLEFGEEQKEIADVRFLKRPAEASLVAADVRTFRACMVGTVAFVFVTVLYLCLYYVLDEGIHIPATFERRFGIPMLGTIQSKELTALAKKLLAEKPVLLTADEAVDLARVKKELAERKIESGEAYRLEDLFGKQGTCVAKAEESPSANGADELSGKKILLIVKAGAHNGKTIEKALDFCEKCELQIAAALLWEADERLIRAYEMPEHVLHVWRKNKD